MQAEPVDYASNKDSSKLVNFIGRHRRVGIICLASLITAAVSSTISRYAIVPRAEYDQVSLQRAIDSGVAPSDGVLQNRHDFEDRAAGTSYTGLASWFDRNFNNQTDRTSNIFALIFGAGGAVLGAGASTYLTSGRKL